MTFETGPIEEHAITIRPETIPSSALAASALIVPTMAALAQAARAAAHRLCSDQQDDEAVHDFRVALRRMRSIARAARPLYGKKRCRKWEAALKDFGDATNALRDAEVLAATVAAAELQGDAATAAAAWLARHRERQTSLLQEAVTLLREGRHEQMLQRVLRELEEPSVTMSLRDFDACASGAAHDGVASLLPVPAGDVARLHRLRIRFKRLRYTAEMLCGNWSATALQQAVAEALGAERCAALGNEAQRASKLQKRLGLLHDVDQALAMLNGDDELAPPHKSALHVGLTRLRHALVQRALNSVEEWSAQDTP